MKLTKEQIEIIRWVVNVDNVHFSERAVAELIRLALLGLEREERRSRVAAFIEAEREYGASVLADSFGAFPDLDLSPDPHEAPWQDERDTRAERIGEAAIAAGDTLRFAIDLAVDEIRNGEGFDDRDIPKLRAIADALEDEA